jgi:exonuclease III
VRPPRALPSPFVYHANVNGIGPRLDELQAATRSATVISLQDTRLQQLPRAEEVWRRYWPDFRPFFFLHDEDGPGCALLVRASAHPQLLERRTTERHRLLVAQLRLDDGGFVAVASLYVPPVSTVDGATLRQDLLQLALGSHRRSVLVGDLNARSEELGCRTTNTNGLELQEFLERSGTVVLNNPAQATFHHASCSFHDCLDWALATGAAANLLYAVLGEDIGSDHLPIVVARPSTTRQPARPPPGRRWRTSRLGWTQAFETDLERRLHERQLVPPPTPSTPDEVEELSQAIQEVVSDSADACLERSRPQPASGKLPLPWWARCLIHERRRQRRRLAARPTDDGLRRSLNDLRGSIRTTVGAARMQYVQKKMAVFARGPKEPSFWPAVRQWFRAPAPDLPVLRRADAASSEAYTPEERAEEFARHLSSALSVPRHASFDEVFFDEVEAEIEADPCFSPTTAVSSEVEPDCPARTVEPAEVNWHVRRLRGGKAPGPDGISTDLLKAAPYGLVVALAALFSGSLATGYVPSRWRLAWIRLLPKPGKALTSAADFRPIALTSCIGKLLERIVARRLLDWCDAHRLLPEEQSGFRRGRDTLEQVVLLTQRAAQALNGGQVTAVAALDVAKAYDSVWHAGLLHQCREVLPDTTSRWIAGFLRARAAAVLESGALSAEFATPGGVPQGSPLAPLLYVFFTRTLPLPRGARTGATVYADDVALWASASDPAAAWRRLEPSLGALVAWGRRWRLRFSAQKTQVAFLSRRAGGWLPAQLGRPSFAGTELSWSHHLDLLGVRVDRRLVFRHHAMRVASRAAPRSLELRRLLEASRTVPPWVGLLLYKSMIRPILTYAAPLFTLSCDTSWRFLERAERRGLRAALRARLDTPTERLYERAAAVRRLRQECEHLSGQFLLRHTHRGNRRLLAAFAEELPQQPGLVRVEGPLERLLACVEPQERPTVVRWIRANMEPPPFRRHPGRTSRAERRPPANWGLSPFEE